MLFRFKIEVTLDGAVYGDVPIATGVVVTQTSLKVLRTRSTSDEITPFFKKRAQKKARRMQRASHTQAPAHIRIYDRMHVDKETKQPCLVSTIPLAA